MTAVVPQQDRLAECEAVIERGLHTFYEVGVALLEIRDERLYRESYGTFEEYCRERWSMGKAYAHRMIAAAEIVDNLSPMGDKPASERQVRPLAELQPEDQRTVWAQAVAESGGEQPTAAKVEDVKVSLLDLVKTRRAVREKEHPEERRTRKKNPHSKKTAATEAPLSRKELAAQRQIMQRNGARNHEVFNCRRAIEWLCEPKVELEFVASELAAMDSPEDDWAGKIRAASTNLRRLKLLLKQELA